MCKGMMTLILHNQGEQFLASINQYINTKRTKKESHGQPNTIKRKELEAFLESAAENFSIDYQKMDEPTRTIYTFPCEGKEAKFEILYRYQNFYTRHDLSME